MNGYKGETSIELYGKKYPMTFNMNVIASFETNTGKDFNNTAIKAINAYKNSADVGSVAERAEIMTGAISMSDAAWLFFLAAKEADKVVEFEEMQEAVMLEGFLAREHDDGELVMSYPIRFVEAVSFATIGILDDLKKKKVSESIETSLKPS